jgi:hypothetical protein
MTKQLFILISLISTSLNLLGQSYTIPIKYVNAQNIASIINGNGFCNADFKPKYTLKATTDKEITIMADEQTYLKLEKVILELDLPLPNVTLQVWDGEKWLF